ncbi:hypothetical protein K523DRAFT_373205 [Schizophyllum commune Tattone D]|nr:hypothetical protein K525DRAFT_186952 [Schizophyllum commune Loenen D]KAI5829047.1 hypothetical protein K523DRAFT_373205 [Schizophyllum commune Tattone D]
MGPQRTQTEHISYVVSEGQRGRNPGVSQELKKLREWGDLSHIADQRNLRPATSGSSDSFAPIYTSPYYETHCSLVSARRLAYLILREVTDTQSPCTIVVEQLRYDTALPPTYVNAANLVSLEVKGGTTNIDEQTRAQINTLFTGLHVPRLIRFHLHIPGKSTREWEATIYRLLRRAKNTLKHLCLELTFCYSKGLQEYLSSSAAARLECLEIKTNVTLQSPINNALQGKKSSKLPNLRLLCLNMDAEKVNLTTLLHALKKRYNGGLKNALRVELNFLPSAEEREQGRAINVTFDGPVTSRCSTFA